MSYGVIEQNKEHMTRWKGFVLSVPGQSRVVGITGQLARVASRSLQLMVVFVLVVSGLTGLIVTAVPGIAAAANSSPTWTIQQSYLAPAGGFSSVSCPTLSDCFAVGENTVRGPALYETTDGGSTWVNDAASLPSGVGVLGGVSCASATFCEAVGSSSGTGVALDWNGSAWTSQTLPSDVGYLNGVSCVSASSCEAVGITPASSGNLVGVALDWNGSTWTSQTIPSGVDMLGGVSCVSATFCEAVGNTSNGIVILTTASMSSAPAPTITGISPTSGTTSGGTSVTITGANFTSSATVMFGTVTATATMVNSSTSIVATSPAESAGTVQVTVTTSSGTSNGASYTYTSSTSSAPTITSITPDSSPLTGGGTATIIGTDLSGESSVNFGSTPASNVKVVSSTEITVTIPPATSPGLVEVTVQASGKTSAGSGFMYVTSGIPYTPVTPYRIADTRCSTNPQPSFCAQENLPSVNKSLSPPPAGGSITVQVTGTGSGSNAVPAGAQSVVVTVTAIASATAHSGYLTVYPAGTNPPDASSLNYTPGMAIPNLVTATLGSGGAIDILSSSADVSIVVDVEGYYEPATGSASSTTNKFTPLSVPIRVLDTRCQESLASSSYCTGLDQVPPANKISAPKADGYIKVQIAGDGGSAGVPSSGVAAVSLVVTAAGPTKGGFLTVFSAGSSTTPPETSDVNFQAKSDSADSVTVALGSTGAIYIYNSAGTATNVIVDINGYFSSTGDVLTPSSPVRICDTRSPSSIGGSDVTSGVSGQCNNSGTPLGTSSGPITVQVTGIAGIPTSAKVVVANITVVNTTGGGYLTAWAAGATQPTTSNINWGKGQIMPNMVLSALNSNGQMEIYTSSTANVIIDVVGWYS